MGRKKEGDTLVLEDLKMHLEVRSGKRSIGVWGNMSVVYFDIGVDYIYLGENDKAVQYLHNALQHDFFHYAAFHKHLLVVTLQGREDFRRLQKIVVDYRAFNKVAFTRAFKGWQGEEGMRAVLK